MTMLDRLSSTNGELPTTAFAPLDAQKVVNDYTCTRLQKLTKPVKILVDVPLNKVNVASLVLKSSCSLEYKFRLPE